MLAFGLAAAAFFGAAAFAAGAFLVEAAFFGAAALAVVFLVSEALVSEDFFDAALVAAFGAGLAAAVGDEALGFAAVVGFASFTGPEGP